MYIKQADQVICGSKPMVIDINNVAQYYYNLKDGNWDISDVKLALPHKSICLFYKQPQYINVEGKMLDVPERKDLVILGAMDDSDLEFHFFMNEFSLDTPICSIKMQVDKSHQIINNGKKSILVKPNNSYVEKMEEFGIPQKDLTTLTFNSIGVLEYFFRFYNCSNVSVKKITTSEKLIKANKRRGGITLEKYHVLEIGNNKITVNYKNTDKTGSRNAMHLCRGHFKHYSEKKPLLGKSTGTYFWNSHVRGDKKYGATKKDYKMGAVNVVS